MEDVFDPLWDQTENQIKYESSINKLKKYPPMKNGRFPCRNCNKTFSLKIKARQHEQRSCKGESTYQNKEVVSNENGRCPCITVLWMFLIISLILHFQQV